MSTKSKKASLKSYLISMFSMVIVAAIALGGATYAWFSIVDNPEVRDIDLYVKAAPNILLSASLATMEPYSETDDGFGTMVPNPRPNFDNASLWHATLFQKNAADLGIDNPDNSIYNPTRRDGTQYIADSQPYAFLGRNTETGMADVSSVFVNDGTSGPNFFKRKINASADFETYLNAVAPVNNIVDNAPATGNFGDYTKFDLWIKSSKSGVVYLDGTKLSDADESNFNFQSYVKPGNLAQYQPKRSIVNTVRIGFHTPADHSATATERFVLWEPNAYNHIPVANGGTGPSGFKDTFAINRIFTAAGDPTGTGLAGNGLSDGTSITDGATKQTSYDFDYGYGGGTELGTNVKGTGLSGDAKSQIALFYLKADEPLKFSVYIWVEGADVDTNNIVAESNFLTKLRFGQFAADSGGPTPSTVYDWNYVTTGVTP